MAYVTDTQLAASDGSRLVGHIANGTGTVTRTVQAKLRDTISIKDFGAVGDGVANDTVAAQAAMNATGGDNYVGKALTMPTGRYNITSVLTSAQFWHLNGAGPWAALFVNQGATTNVLFDVLAPPAGVGQIGFVDYEDFAAQNFRSLFRCVGPVDTMRWTRVHAYQCTGAAFEFNGFLQTSVWDNVVINGGQYGIVSNTTTVNAIDLRGVQFINLTDSALKLAGSEDFTLLNCRFEGGGGSAANSILRLTGNQHLTVIGGYFEGAQGTVLTWNGGGGQVSFEGTHFTFYAENTPYKFDTDGNILFRNCDFAIPTRPPASATIEGQNRNLIRCEYSGSIRGSHRRPASVGGSGPFTQQILGFNRVNPANTPSNATVLLGTLRYTASYSSADGGTFGRTAREYRVVVTGYAGNILSVTLTAISVADEGSAGSIISVGAAPSATALDAGVRVSWSLNPTTIANCTQGFTFEWDQSCGLSENTFAISVA